jgi:phospholipid transport system substrate-binding protein
VVGGAADGARLDYRMRARDGEWKVIDVVIERISLISNFRSQIQEVVSSEGPERVIEILREKNAERGS